MSTTDTKGCFNLPAVFALLILWSAITLFGAVGLYGRDVALDTVVTSGIAWQLVLACALLVGTITLMRWPWPGLGFRAPAAGTLRLMWLPALMILLLGLLALARGLPPAPVVLLLLANTFLVGFSEEVMFRGVFFAALRQRLQIWPAILLTSLCFGAVHVLNGFLTGDFHAAIVQSVAAAASGVVFIAILLRTGSIWPAILYHMLWDWLLFIANQSPSSAEVPVDLPAGAAFLPFLLVLPNLLYGLWLLRHAGRSSG